MDLIPIDTNGDNRPDKGAMVVLASSLIASPAFDCNGQGPLNDKGQRQILKFSINRDTVPEDRNAANLPLICADAGGYVPVEVHAWDQLGNHSYCTSFLFVTDNQNACVPRIGFIAGEISTEEKNMVEDVEVFLSGGANQTMVTKADGKYFFEDIDSGYDYSVYPSRNTDFANGVTTFDLVLIQQHILGQKLLASPYKIIAADINNSKSVTTLDMVQLRRVILNLEPRFPSNRSWRFVSASHVFTDPYNPWNRPFPEVLSYNDLPDTVRHGNFIGVKIGDVSGNVVANSQMIRIRSNSSRSVAVAVSQAELPEGTVYRIPITASGWKGISGCQFTLEYDREALTLIDVEPGLAEEGAFAVFEDEGAITLSYVVPSDGIASDTTALITIVVQANRRADLKYALRRSSRLTPSAAYDMEGREFSMELAFEGEKPQAPMPELYQNVPNPFAEETIIRFALPEAQQAEISIFDLKGRLLLRKEGLYESGVNEILVRKSGLNAKGVLFYTLKTVSFTATKKMLVLD
ncbi:MAG: T9SS type A sorting domain-containing protein [Haliscomenobacter sp.]|nr:T9SS type A sorting domain-containing protein [Haliscomenobacter sp.]